MKKRLAKVLLSLTIALSMVQNVIVLARADEIEETNEAVSNIEENVSVEETVVIDVQIKEETPAEEKTVVIEKVEEEKSVEETIVIDEEVKDETPAEEKAGAIEEDISVAPI